MAANQHDHSAMKGQRIIWRLGTWTSL